MKKAKNALTITAIAMSVVAVLLLLLIPCFDGIAASVSGGSSLAIAERFSNNFTEVLDRVKMLFNFPEIFGNLSGNILTLVVLGVGAVGLLLLVVLFIVLLAKKHSKGLGWWFPMLVLFAASVVVAGIGLIKEPKFYAISGYTYTAYQQLGFLTLIVLIFAGVSAVLFMVASILYMVYVCQANGAKKEVEDARKAALEKIESLLGLGGNK